jgi:hypothetical protein
MFQSLSYTLRGYSNEHRGYTWEYELTDSEFGTVSGVGAGTIAGGVEVGIAVIQEYSKRNLNVAANLIKGFIWYNKQYAHSIQHIIAYNKKYNPLFQRYEKDLQKYLVLL